MDEMKSCENCKYQEECEQEVKECLGWYCDNYDLSSDGKGFFQYELEAMAREQQELVEGTTQNTSPVSAVLRGKPSLKVRRQDRRKSTLKSKSL